MRVAAGFVGVIELALIYGGARAWAGPSWNGRPIAGAQRRCSPSSFGHREPATRIDLPDSRAGIGLRASPRPRLLAAFVPAGERRAGPGRTPCWPRAIAVGCGPLQRGRGAFRAP